MGGVIWAGSNPQDFDRNLVGGKGLYLLKLFYLAQQTGMFEVPNYFIIPTDAQRHYRNTHEGTRAVFEDTIIEASFGRLQKPVAVRSSSPLEDGLQASFAGMFTSFLNVHDYHEMGLRANTIYESPFQERVMRYAERMGIQFSHAMALIVQEQVTDALEWGIIQLEDKKAVIEITDRNGRQSSEETEFALLDEIFPEGYIMEIKPQSEPRDYFNEGEYHYAPHCAREAKKRLGLEGIVQVEFFLSPAKLPTFIQIRQLPNVQSYVAALDLEIPDSVPYIESEICNDVAGELVLPAYVTTSQAGFRKILIETGQSFLMGLGKEDARAERFNQQSMLTHNHDFQKFIELALLERTWGLGSTIPHFNRTWERGNELFDAYILICDKLDESICAMADVTTNKRAIITCLEAEKTSHAMAVARDLGIMCMGVQGYLSDLHPLFFHQIETGDIIHMKSDGKKAVAYLEKKRITDPYTK